MEARFISFVRDRGLISPGDRLLCAHSGGGDSTFLFEMLLRSRDGIGFEFDAAHVNHGLRGKAADDDEEFVRSMCESAGIRFASRAVSVEDIRSSTGISLEMAARKLRYEALEAMAVEAGCTKVAFAHQADDRVETFLMRLLKGAGPDGLASIPIRRPMDSIELIRPLFAFSRTEIIGWLKSNGIDYCTDETNLDKSIARNAVREDLLPLLEERFNPSVRKAISQAIEAIERDSKYFTHTAVELNRHRYRKTDDGLILDLDGFGEIDTPVMIRMILEAFTRLAGDEYRCGYEHLMGAVGLWLEGKRNDRINFPEGWVVIRIPEGLHIRPTPQFTTPPEIDGLILTDGESELPEIFSLRSEIVGKDQVADLKHPPENTVYITAALIGKLKIDYNNRTGRIICPLGMGGRTHKISDIVSRAGIAKHRREWIVLLTNIDDPMEVLAIPHLGLISESAKVKITDTEILVVTVAPSVEIGIP